MIQLLCQWGVLALIVANLLAMIYKDLSKPDQTSRFIGFLLSIILQSLVGLLLYGAGAFDKLPNSY